MSTVRLNMREVEFIFRHIKFSKKLKEKYPKEPHRWYKKKSSAEREFRRHFKKKISRPTIDKLITLYPEGIKKKPKKIEPRYVEQFKESESWRRLKDHKYAKLIYPYLFIAWKLLGQTEPLDWTENDIRSLRKPTVKGQDNRLYLSLTKDIAPEGATNLRRALHALGLYGLEKPLERVPKRPIGVRKQWYLEGNELIKLFQLIRDPELLLFVVLDVQCGARPSSMVAMKVSDINWEKNYIHYYESKTKEHVPRFFVKETMSLLKRYVSDMRLKFNQKLFSKTADTYTVQLKGIGKKAKIEKLILKGAGAYVLRHTFATQASEHDVSMEVVMKQGNWKDAKTVLDHYMFVKTSKMRRELLGEVVEKPKNFGDWIRQFVPYWEKRYLEIRPVAIRR